MNEPNYYEMQLSLRKYEYKLLNTIDIKEIEFLILEIKSYIFSKDELKTEFVNRITSFENLMETLEYKENSQKIYEKVKTLTKQLAIKNNKKMYYSNNTKWCDSEQFAYIRSNENKYDNFITGDYSELFLFNSVLLPNMSFNSDEALTKNGKLINIKISNSLQSFYNSYNYKYNDIIKIPENLEFYISCADIKILSIYSLEAICPFNLVYVATSLCKVLNTLDDYLISKTPLFFKLPQNNTNTVQSQKNNPLSNEEIQILSLRKNLQSNTYKDIAESLGISCTGNNIGQKMAYIKSKLGAKSPDEAVKIFEEKYYSL